MSGSADSRAEPAADAVFEHGIHGLLEQAQGLAQALETELQGARRRQRISRVLVPAAVLLLVVGLYLGHAALARRVGGVDPLAQTLEAWADQNLSRIADELVRDGQRLAPGLIERAGAKLERAPRYLRGELRDELAGELAGVMLGVLLEPDTSASAAGPAASDSEARARARIAAALHEDGWPARSWIETLRGRLERLEAASAPEALLEQELARSLATLLAQGLSGVREPLQAEQARQVLAPLVGDTE